MFILMKIALCQLLTIFLNSLSQQRTQVPQFTPNSDSAVAAFQNVVLNHSADELRSLINGNEERETILKQIKVSLQDNICLFKNKRYTFIEAIQADFPMNLIVDTYKDEILDTLFSQNQRQVCNNILKYINDESQIRDFWAVFQKYIDSKSTSEPQYKQKLFDLLQSKGYTPFQIYDYGILSFEEIIKVCDAEQVFNILKELSKKPYAKNLEPFSTLTNIPVLNKYLNFRTYDTTHLLKTTKTPSIKTLLIEIAKYLDNDIVKFKEHGYSYMDAVIANFKGDEIIEKYNITNESELLVVLERITTKLPKRTFIDYFYSKFPNLKDYKENNYSIFLPLNIYLEDWCNTRVNSPSAKDFVKAYDLKTKISFDSQGESCLKNLIHYANMKYDRDFSPYMRKRLCDNDLNKFKENGFTAENAYDLSFNCVDIIKTYNLTPKDKIFKYIVNDIAKEIISKRNVEHYNGLNEYITNLYQGNLKQFKDDGFNLLTALLFFNVNDVIKTYNPTQNNIAQFKLYQLAFIEKNLAILDDINKTYLFENHNHIETFHLINCPLINPDHKDIKPNLNLYYNNNSNTNLPLLDNNKNRYIKVNFKNNSYCIDINAKDYYMIVYEKVKKYFNDDINEFKKHGYNATYALFAGFDVVDIFKTYTRNAFELFNYIVKSYRESSNNNPTIEPDKLKEIIDIIKKLTNNDIKNLVFYELDIHGIENQFKSNAQNPNTYMHEYYSIALQYLNLKNTILSNSQTSIHNAQQEHNVDPYDVYLNTYFKNDLKNFLKCFSININDFFFNKLKDAEWSKDSNSILDNKMYKKIKKLDDLNLFNKYSSNGKSKFYNYITTHYQKGNPSRYNNLTLEQQAMLKKQIKYLSYLTSYLNKLKESDPTLEFPQNAIIKDLYDRIIDLYSDTGSYCESRLATIISDTIPLFNQIEYILNNNDKINDNELNNIIIIQFLEAYRTKVFDSLKALISNNVHITNNINNRFADLFAVPYIKSNDKSYIIASPSFIINIYKYFKLAFESTNFEDVLDELGSLSYQYYYDNIKIKASNEILASLNINREEYLTSLEKLKVKCTPDFNKEEYKKYCNDCEGILDLDEKYGNYYYIEALCEWLNGEKDATISDLESSISYLSNFLNEENSDGKFESLFVFILRKKYALSKILPIYLKENYGIILPNKLQSK